MKGLNFVIEGIDGAGKTTQALELVSWLNGKEKNRGFYAKSPCGCSLGEKIRGLANDPKASSQVKMIAFLLSNIIFYQEIVIPKITKGQVVVFDRWTGSFINYFSLFFNFSRSFLNELHKKLLGDFSADRTFLLDVPVEIAAERLKEKKNLSKYDTEGPEFMENQRRGFLELAQEYNWTVIDGSKPASTIKDEIISLINPLL